MAEIDQLSIGIAADSSKAEKAIDGLITKLHSLNDSLDLGNLSNFTTQLKDITSAASGLKEIGSSIRSIATAGSNLSKLTGFKTLNDQAKETRTLVDGIAKSYGELFNISPKNQKNLANYLEANAKNFNRAMAIGLPLDSLADFLKQSSAYIRPVSAEAQQILDYAKRTRLYVDETTASWLKQGGKLKEVRQTFAGFSTDIRDAKRGFASAEDESTLDIWRSMGIPVDGKDQVEAIKEFLEAYKRAKEELKNATLKGEDQIKAKVATDGYFKEYAEKIAKEVSAGYDRILSEEKQQKDIFGSIIPSLEKLQGITLPDFSGLDTLAAGMERLSKVNPAKVAAIVDALQGTGNASIGGSVRVMAQAVDDVVSALSKEGNAANFIVDEFGKISALNIDAPFKTIIEELRNAGNAADFVVDKAGNIARISDETANAIKGVAQGFELAIRSSAPLANAMQTCRDLATGFGFTLRSGVEEGFEVAIRGVNELNEAFEGLREYSNNMLSTEVFEDIKDSAEGIKDAFDDIIDVDYKEINEFFTTAPLDEFSRHLHDVIMNMEKYSSIMSGMREHPGTMDYQGYIEAAKKLHEARTEWEDFERDVEREVKFGEVDYSSLDDVSKKLTETIEQKKEYDRIISSMEGGQTVANADLLSQAYKGSTEAAKEIEKLEKSLGKVSGNAKEASKSSIDLLANLVALGHEIRNIANAFDKMGDKGITALKWMYKPVVAVANEYKEKLSSIGDFFKSFADRAQKSLVKLSSFWKRSMKTFTFMLVRKAITAVLNEINDATKSLALWSKQFGTIFNDSMSQITSNLSYMARAIVGAFEPLINAVVPIINALSDAVANAAARLGEFFAALTGQGYYMQAVRQVTDYADSVNKANKAQKNLIAGLDDLNVITTPTSTAAGMDDLAEQWNKVDVSDKMKDWADRVKDVAKRLFDPIKKAWDEAGDHVVKGFKYMVGEIAKLGKSIGRDFMIVWEQPNTQKIFENILHTIGYIEEGIGNIAKRFREAWDEGDKGLHILENIRDIILIITDHIRNMAKTFRDWADDLNFNPLLAAVESLTKKIQPLIDFIFGVIEDYWERVVLRHWKWLIEEGLPHIGATIERIIASFDFPDLRAKLQPLMDAFETMRESIDTGIVNAIGNLGERIGHFTQSEEFASFLENVAWFMNQITAERVEKLFTALGDAVLNVAEALMKFVGSDKFKDFMQKLFDWYDSLSTEDIAGFITKIATAIAVFKFTAFVGKGLEGFLSFMSVLTAGKGALKDIGGLFKGIGDGISKVFGKSGLGGLITGGIEKLFPAEGLASKIFTALGTAFKTVGSVLLKGSLIVAIVTGVAMVINNWGSIEPVLAKIADMIFSGIGQALGGLARFIGEQLVGAIRSIGDYFKESAEEVGGNIILGILWGILKAIVAIPVWIYNHVVKPFIDGFRKGFDSHSPARVMIPIGMDIIGGLFEGILGIIAGVGAWLMEHVVGPIIGFFADAGSWLFEHGKALIQGLADGIETMKDALSEKWENIKEAASKKWEDIKSSVMEIAENLRSDLSDKWEEAKKNASEKFTQLRDNATELFSSMRDKVVEKARDMKEKVVSKVQEMKRDALAKITELKNEAVNKFHALKEEAVAKFNELKDNAISALHNLKENAVSAFNNMKDTVVGIAVNIKDDVVGRFNDMVGGAQSAFWNVVDSAGSILGNVKSTVQNAFHDASSWLSSAGSNIVQGLSNGITGAKNLVTRAFDNITGWGSQRFTSSAYGWGIHSPSTLTEEWGEYIDLGLFNGITDNAYKVMDSMQNLAVESQQAFLNHQADFNAIATDQMAQFSQGIMAQMHRVSDVMGNMAHGAMTSFSNAFSGIKEVGTNVVAGLVDGINSKMRSLVDAVRDMASRVVGTFRGVLDIHSPSGVFEEFGEYVVEGFNNGIENLASSTDKTVNAWLKDVMNFSVPEFDISSAIPKSNLRTDLYSHDNISGAVGIDNSAIEDGVRAGVTEVVGGLLLPYLRDIAESSRTTAGKSFGITEKQVGQAAANFARDYYRKTGRLAYGT